MYIKSLRGAGDIACKGHQDFHFGSDAGFGISVRSKIGQDMRIQLERWVSLYGRKQLIPHNVEDNTFEQRSEVNRNPYCEQFSAAGN